jgi:hypothetical protein
MPVPDVRVEQMTHACELAPPQLAPPQLAPPQLAPPQLALPQLALPQSALRAALAGLVGQVPAWFGSALMSPMPETNMRVLDA